MKSLHTRKIKSTRSCLRPWCKPPADSMANLYMFIGVLLENIHGSARRPTAKRSTPIQRGHARTTAANPPSFAEWRGPNATVRFLHRDDREPAGPESPSRLAI